MDVVSGDPLILALDGLCSEARVAELLQLLEQQSAQDRIHTRAYVDDMFEERRGAEEDAHLLWCVGSAGIRVPRGYCTDPLRSFLWAAKANWERLPQEEDALRRAQLAVARRAWQTQWDPEDIARSGFRKAATRWKVPEPILRSLAPLVVEILGTGVRGLPGSEEAVTGKNGPRCTSWVLRDSTVVRYGAGESQVPHMDTCDLTLLLYLSDTGGPTCFPVVGRQVAPARGRLLVFFSTFPEEERFGGFAGSAHGRPNEATMHYGGMAEAGEDQEKLVVQLLLSVEDLGTAASWRDVLRGGLFRGAGNLRRAPRRASSPLAPRPGQRGAQPRLALSAGLCAAGCVGRALDLETPDGAPKRCIWCWNSWLERSVAAEAGQGPG